MKLHRRDLLPSAAVVVLILGGIAVGSAFASKNGGAIFTTNAAGTAVNQNQYASKGDVFLNGGPQNGNCAAAGLSDGDYVFQVTDPSGKTLLSSDDIVQRRFSVSGGVVSAYLGSTHAVGNGPCNSKAIGLAPFNTSSNNGDEYKVWVAPAASYSPSQGVFGFKSGDSKTDNFKIETGAAVSGTTLLGRTYQDLNTNGTDDAEPGMAGVTVSLKSSPTSTVVIASAVSDAGGYYSLTGVAVGTYALCETKPPSWYATEPNAAGCATVTASGTGTISQNFGNAPENLD